MLTIIKLHYTPVVVAVVAVVAGELSRQRVTPSPNLRTLLHAAKQSWLS